jgi:hypothetical protein
VTVWKFEMSKLSFHRPLSRAIIFHRNEMIIYFVVREFFDSFSVPRSLSCLHE